MVLSQWGHLGILGLKEQIGPKSFLESQIHCLRSMATFDYLCIKSIFSLWALQVLVGEAVRLSCTTTYLSTPTPFSLILIADGCGVGTMVLAAPLRLLLVGQRSHCMLDLESWN
jgi:hypothetical protein